MFFTRKLFSLYGTRIFLYVFPEDDEKSLMTWIGTRNIIEIELSRARSEILIGRLFTAQRKFTNREIFPSRRGKSNRLSQHERGSGAVRPLRVRVLPRVRHAATSEFGKFWNPSAPKWNSFRISRNQSWEPTISLFSCESTSTQSADICRSSGTKLVRVFVLIREDNWKKLSAESWC